MSISSFRSLLYRAASLLGDLQAIRKGTIVPRLARKYTTKVAFGGLRSLWRLFK